MTNHNLRQIHQLLINAYTEDQLRRLINLTDGFRHIRAEIARADNLAKIADVLLEYCEKQGKLELLLEDVARHNAYQYQRYLGIFSDLNRGPIEKTKSEETEPSVLIFKQQEQTIQYIAGRDINVSTSNKNEEHEIRTTTDSTFTLKKGTSLKLLLKLKENIEKRLEEFPSIKKLSIDDSDAIAWRGAIEIHMATLDEILPGSNFEEKYTQIAWHKPNQPATQRDYERGCELTKGRLKIALLKIEEKLDMV